MKPSADTYADLFTMNFQAVRALVRDVTEDEARRPPDGRQNPMLWIAGHVTTYRVEALSILGATPGRGLGLKASFGKDMHADPATWPSLAQVVADFSELHPVLVETLKGLGDAAFDKMTVTPGGTKVPAIVFMHFHESYHVGQLGYVRTWLRKSPLVRPGPPPSAA